MLSLNHCFGSRGEGGNGPITQCGGIDALVCCFAILEGLLAGLGQTDIGVAAQAEVAAAAVDCSPPYPRLGSGGLYWRIRPCWSPYFPGVLTDRTQAAVRFANSLSFRPSERPPLHPTLE